MGEKSELARFPSSLVSHLSGWLEDISWLAFPFSELSEGQDEGEEDRIFFSVRNKCNIFFLHGPLCRRINGTDSDC